MDYPDKGVMGLARHNPSGQVRLGLSATAASAVLYSAIVLLGVGSASPSALDAGGNRHKSVVLIPRHADTVSGSVQKLPQASPEPGRHPPPRARTQQTPTAVRPTSSTAPTVGSPPPPVPPRGTESVSPRSVTDSATAGAPAPLPDVTVPTLPVAVLPVPVLPELPAVPPLPLPELPATPPLPLP